MALSPNPQAVKIITKLGPPESCAFGFKEFNHAKTKQKNNMSGEKQTRTGHFFRLKNSFREEEIKNKNNGCPDLSHEKNTLSIEYCLFNGDRYNGL